MKIKICNELTVQKIYIQGKKKELTDKKQIS